MPQWCDALDGGFFTVTCNPIVGDKDRGVQCTICFHPSNPAKDSVVGLIQACHPIKFHKKEGKWIPYRTGGGEILSPTDWFIDAGDSKNPVYGMVVDDRKELGVKFNLEAGRPDRYDWGTGYYGGYSATKLNPAIIRDQPSRHWAGQAIKHEFESAALCLSGERRGRSLGVVRWGYEVDDKGVMAAMQPQFSQKPTDDWLGAATAWNNVGTNIKIPTPV
jgi:hypothetical protein